MKKNTITLLQVLDTPYPSLPSEIKEDLVTALPELITACESKQRELSIKHFTNFSLLLYKLFDDFDDTDKPCILLLFLKNCSLEFYSKLSEDNMELFLGLIAKIYEYAIEHLSELVDYNKSISTLLLRNITLLAGSLGNKGSYKNSLLTKYPPILQYLTITQISLNEYSYGTDPLECLGLLTIMLDLNRRTRSNNIDEVIYKVFNDFLCKSVISNKNSFEMRESKLIGWTNWVLLQVGKMVEYDITRREQLAVSISNKYLKIFGGNKRFRGQIVEDLLNNTTFTESKLFMLLDFSIKRPQKNEDLLTFFGETMPPSILTNATMSECFKELSITEESKILSDLFYSKSFDSRLLETDAFDSKSFVTLDNKTLKLDQTEIIDQSFISCISENPMSINSSRGAEYSVLSNGKFPKEVARVIRVINGILNGHGRVICKKLSEVLKEEMEMERLNDFINKFTSYKDTNMKITLKPFYDKFIPELKNILTRKHFKDASICTWSNSNETYFTSAKELCISIGLNSLYNPVLVF